MNNSNLRSAWIKNRTVVAFTVVPIVLFLCSHAAAQEANSATSSSEQTEKPASGANPFSKFFGNLKKAVDDAAIKNQGSQAASSSPSPFPGELEHLFAKSPFVTGTPLRAQFPRVAFTVLESPPNHAQMEMAINVGQQLNEYRACWKLSAVIWLSADQSTSVRPFTACFPDIVAGLGQITITPYEDWWGIKGEIVTLASDDTTGSQRTAGPLPPSMPFPQGVQYLRYFHSTISMVGPESSTLESYLWTAILYRMDFDPTQIMDRRVWVIKYIPVEG